MEIYFVDLTLREYVFLNQLVACAMISKVKYFGRTWGYMLWSTNFTTKFYFFYQELVKPFKIFVWKDTQVVEKRKMQAGIFRSSTKYNFHFWGDLVVGKKKEKGSAHTGLCTSSLFPIFLVNYSQKICERFIGWIDTLLWGEAGDAFPWWGRFTDISFPSNTSLDRLLADCCPFYSSYSLIHSFS